MNKTQATLREILGVLCQLQHNCWSGEDPRDQPKQITMDTYHLLMRSWLPVKREEIDKWIGDSSPMDIDLCRKRKAFYLPVLDEHPNFVPVLSVKCNLSASVALLKLRLMLFCSDDGCDGLCGIGFRLETPQGGESDPHNFYHAQLIRTLEPPSRDEEEPDVECPVWVPETQPSFPLVAQSPVSLLLCLLMTLYGAVQGLNFVTGRQIFGLDPELQTLKARMGLQPD